MIKKYLKIVSLKDPTYIKDICKKFAPNPTLARDRNASVTSQEHDKSLNGLFLIADAAIPDVNM